ncbi:hypothetical protein BDV06DRAFT_224900 [Aspergillus oleicola]
MFSFLTTSKEQEYEILSQPLEESYQEQHQGNRDTPLDFSRRKHTSRCIYTLYILGFVLSLAAAFTTGVLFTLYSIPDDYDSGSGQEADLHYIAPYLPLPRIAGEIIHNSPFSKEPPQGPGAGNVSEEIWDALVPDGLGYFRHQPTTNTNTSPSTIVIPTIFHQLHCLYLLRRAYYSHTTSGPDSGADPLERFDFNRNRTVHVAHCFDYLAQTLVCSADSTLEPAVDTEHGYLGSGFQRRCWDFERLKEIVQEKRVFDAEGFLAWGLTGEGVVHFG